VEKGHIISPSFLSQPKVNSVFSLIYFFDALGFRKLRSDPILTNDVDPQTANYVRFYHEKFQKDCPDLLHEIKRATKSEQHAKDDVDCLKSEVCRLKECVQSMSSNMERQLAEMSYEYNCRITNLSTEYEKLANLVTQLLQHHQHPNEHTALLHHHPHHVAAASASPGLGGLPSMMEASYFGSSSVRPNAASALPLSSSPLTETEQSLSHIRALRMQKQQQQQYQSEAGVVMSEDATEKVGDKRSTSTEGGSNKRMKCCR
jgi:hypothetical protein